MDTAAAAKCKFFDLPLELYLEIFEYLDLLSLEEQAKEGRRYVDPDDDGEFQRSPEQLVQPMLQVFPGLVSLARLSETCWFFNNLLASRVFKVVYLNNWDDNIASIRALIDGPRCQFVQELRFAGYPSFGEQEEFDAPVPEDGYESRGDFVAWTEEKESPESDEDDLPAPLLDILSDLRRFPNLKHLSIEFPFTFEQTETDNSYNIYVEVSDYAHEGARWPWQRLMSRVFGAVLRNGASHSLETLSLPKMHAVPILDLEDGAAAAFLSKIKTFDFSLRNYIEGGRSHSINRIESFSAILHHWAEGLFDKLESVETLTLAFPNGAPLIHDRIDHGVPLLWHVDKLPTLRNLTLKNIQLERDVLQALRRLLDTMRSLTLYRCFCDAGADDNDCIDVPFSDNFTWAKVFRGLRQHEHGGLTHFECSGSIYGRSGGFITREYSDDGFETEAEASDGVLRLGLETQRMPFLYACPHPEIGDAECSVAQMLRGLRRGNDQGEYELLMETVASNGSSDERGEADCQMLQL